MKIRVKDPAFFVRNVRMRLPFRYGKAELVAAPLLHVRTIIEGQDGKHAHGAAADMLPPKWFDKNPAKSYRDNVNDLITAARCGANAFTEAGASPRTFFDLWQTAHNATRVATKEAGLNGLTGEFGASLLERATLDGLGRLAGKSFHAMLRDNTLAMAPETIHNELAGMKLHDHIPELPLPETWIRHTVGLGDPILDSDIAPNDRLDDGLPQSVEAWIRDAGVRFFKIKVTGGVAVDGPRLKALAALLDERCPRGYGVTLDGNEQFASAEAFGAWFEHVRAMDVLDTFLHRVLFIEQPIERTAALTTHAGKLKLGGIPLLLDESDDALDAFHRGIDQGYSGVSVKNCKGVVKAVLNHLLAHRFTQNSNETFFLSGEDLCNQPVVPLQQDLCAMSALRIHHVERNGHHFGGPMDHVPPTERTACLTVHDDLYEPFRDSARVRIRDGRISLRSLQVPGLGVGIDTDFESMIPLDQWRFDSLGITE